MELVLHPETRSNLAVLKRPGFYIVFGESGIGKKAAITQHLSSEDLQVLSPQKNKITLEMVVEATAQFNLKSSNKPTYMIIDEAHQLSDYAQNALLKTLEELPEYATVVMITDEPERIFSTVKSRAFFIHIPSPSVDQVSAWLQSNQEDTTTNNIIETVGPRPAVLSRYLDDPKLADEHMALQSSIERICTGTLYERLQAASKLQPHMPQVLDMITRYARNKMRQEGDELWQEVIMACGFAIKLASANSNKKFILDSIAIRSTSWQN